jgi:hypothetical protein
MDVTPRIKSVPDLSLEFTRVFGALPVLPVLPQQKFFLYILGPFGGKDGGVRDIHF